MTDRLAQLSKGVLNDLAAVFAAMPENALDGLIEAIVAAKRIVVFGLGREGLQMRGFAMRLFHMGSDVARKGGARTALVTARPTGALAKQVDVITVIPAQTMANDQGGKLSVLPMGSLFETAQMIAFELVIFKLRPRFGEPSETMRARHTNLE